MGEIEQDAELEKRKQSAMVYMEKDKPMASMATNDRRDSDNQGLSTADKLKAIPSPKFTHLNFKMPSNLRKFTSMEMDAFSEQETSPVKLVDPEKKDNVVNYKKLDPLRRKNVLSMNNVKLINQ